MTDKKVVQTVRIESTSGRCNDVVVEYRIIDDDGTSGFFWRKGERWLRETDREHRMLDLAPHLEAENPPLPGSPDDYARLESLKETP